MTTNTPSTDDLFSDSTSERWRIIALLTRVGAGVASQNLQRLHNVSHKLVKSSRSPAKTAEGSSALLMGGISRSCRNQCHEQVGPFKGQEDDDEIMNTLVSLVDTVIVISFLFFSIAQEPKFISFLPSTYSSGQGRRIAAAL